MKKFISILLVAVMALSVFAGCGSEKTETTESAAPVVTEAAAPETTAAAKLSGTVSTDGSTSMEKVIGALGESFMEANDGVTFTYNPTGSGSGIKAVIVNPENTVEDLSIETIAKIFTGEITNWSEVGGADAEIVLIGREAGSGTRGGFEEIVGVEDACKYRQELTSTGDVITAVAQNPGAIGYASLASVKDTVKAVKVEGVTPSEETVKDESYAIQRPFVLVTKDGVELSETAQAFFTYATNGEANEVITAAGVVPAN